MKVRRVIGSEGSGRTPGRWSTATISRRSRSSSDMGHLLSMDRLLFVDLSGLALLDLANLSDVKNATCRLGQVAYCFFLLLLQFDGQIRRLARRDSYRLLNGPGK